MPGSNLWKLEGGNALLLENNDFRLSVQQKSGWALFRVWQHFRQQPAHPPVMVMSGVRNSVREAMAAAEKALSRMTVVLIQGQPSTAGVRNGSPLLLRDDPARQAVDAHHVARLAT